MVLSERQKEILMAIIMEYMKDAEEVGSNQLVRDYDMKMSSATVRNEMVKLMDLGYLDKSHISSGRVPTDMAFRLFVNEKVMPTDNGDVRLVEIRQNIFKDRFYPEKLTKSILHTLVENTGAASFVLLDDMSRHYGVSSLPDYKEMQDIKTLQRILDLLEDEDLMKTVFSRAASEDVSILIGNELGVRDLEDCALIFTKFNFWDNRSGHMGIIGARRMDYRQAIPVVRAVRESVHDSLKGWS